MNLLQVNKLRIIIFFILSIYFGSCNDPFIIVVQVDGKDTGDCFFPRPEKVTGYDFVFDSIAYERPYFNPINPDEFIYLENGDLYKYTISTAEKSLLYFPERYIYFQPKWSRKGKIAFNTSDYNIWMMKDNGDSLTKITNVGGDVSANYYGEFNYTGDSLMFHSSGSFTDGDTKKIRVAYNNFLDFDTLNSSDASPSTNWQKSGYFLDIGYQTIALSNIASKTSEIIILNDTISDHGIIWLPNKFDFICYREDGVYTGNFEMNFITKVKEMCPHIFYLFPCYSEISGKVITSKITKEYLGDNMVHVKTEIIMMNPDGSDEQVILPKPE